MGKTKCILTGKVLEKSNDNFDWSLYENGYTGGNSLVVNKSVKVKSPNDKVYCHEPYAQALYDMYEAYTDGSNKYNPKDALKGTVYSVTDIRAVSDHEISIDTTNGMSAVIDLNKEKQYLDTLNCRSVDLFVAAVKTRPDFRKSLIENNLNAKVIDNGRVSLWDGHLAKIEAEFVAQIKNPTSAYYATVKEINNGGYLVDIQGIKCFLPGSLAAAGILTDFEALLGKTIPVMIVNYVPASGFVVSYKKYLEIILPSKIEEELTIGQEVACKVTGSTKNGVFVQFKDKNGEWIFSGLIHRSVMSKDFEERFDHHEFRVNDEMHAFISDILENNGKYRIVLSDSLQKVNLPNKEEE